MGRTSHSEQLCKDLLDWYLPANWRKQENLRPDWLRNPKTGRRLEIDRYYPDLKLGIELDGIQHGRFVKGMHKSYQAAIDGQARDMAKIEQCKAQGVRLIKLDIFDLVQFNFEPFIKQLMRDYDIGHEFQRKTPPRLLYVQAERLSRAKAVKGQPYRKSGLLPLLQRAWKRWKKGQRKEVYGSN
jgi:hypothetical protein